MELGTRKELERGMAMMGIGHAVVEVDCMLKSKGPEISLKLLGPVEERVEHDCTCPCGDSLDRPFRHTGLVMGTNS